MSNHALSATSTDKAQAQTQSNPLAELSPGNRDLFDALREAAQKGNDGDVLVNGKKLLPHNIYLVALIYTDEGKENYRMELESLDADQAFFKTTKPGERRFSIDTFQENETNANWSESQALNGFIDGVFNYDVMRDRMLKVPNGEKSSSK
jgi:hypothetical protein